MKKTIENFAGLLETRTRANGSPFICLKDDAPDWAADIVRDAHGDMMPDDWRYRIIREISYALAESWNDDGCEVCDSLVPVYHSVRYDWLASHLSRAGYVDEAAADYCAPDTGISDRIACGMLAEYMEVYATIFEAFDD